MVDRVKIKASTLLAATQLIEGLNEINEDLKRFASKDPKDDFSNVVSRAGNNQLKYKPIRKHYLEFLQARKAAILKLLADMNIDVDE